MSNFVIFLPRWNFITFLFREFSKHLHYVNEIHKVQKKIPEHEYYLIHRKSNELFLYVTKNMFEAILNFIHHLKKLKHKILD